MPLARTPRQPSSTLKLFAAAGFALILVEALMMISPERLPHV